jgi:Protein of unknown function (DUF2442)
MISQHIIQNVTFDDSNILLVVDGQLIKVSLEHISLKLKNASEFQRNFYKISPSGYGIHWPLIDEDISISALLKNKN